MNKDEIIKNLKEELIEKNFTPAEKKTEIEIIDKKENKIETTNRKNKKKFKKNKKVFDIKEKIEVENIREEIEKSEYETEEFIKFRDKFYDLDEQKEFISVILSNFRNQGVTEITNNEYLLLKMKHPKLKALLRKPSFEEITNDQNGVVYFIRPLYLKEQNEFENKIGNQLEFPVEYANFLLETCVEYPKLSKEEINTMPAGIALTLKHSISEMSDLTKKFQIIEL